MVVDTSAIIAILFNEPDKRLYSEAIDSAPLCLISAVTRVELAFVAEGKKGEAGRRGLEEFLALSGTEVVAVNALHAEIAIGPSGASAKAATAPASTSPTASPTRWPPQPTIRCFSKATTLPIRICARQFQPRVKGPIEPTQPPRPSPYFAAGITADSKSCSIPINICGLRCFI